MATDKKFCRCDEADDNEICPCGRKGWDQIFCKKPLSQERMNKIFAQWAEDEKNFTSPTTGKE